MNARSIWKRLGFRLLISYVVVLLVGAAILISTASLLAPTSVSRHVDAMASVVGDHPALVEDLYRTFTRGVMEVLGVAGGVALLAALLVSLFTARRIVTPIRDMTAASLRIAAGDFAQRVPVPGDDELGALAQSFNRMAERLDETERRRLELIGDVAHELRTPLASIRAGMEGLIDGVLEAGPESYAGIEAEAARLQRLVRDLEELSAIEAGQFSLERQAVPLQGLLEAVVERLRGQYDDQGVGLELHAPSDNLRVNADPGRALQVLTNLVGNALQHTPSGGRVELSACREGGEAVVSVSDSGRGIAAEHLPHLFERFYRVDRSRSRAGGGSGIGLTIARHLVEAHGGRIWAASEGPGRGSTFSFTLPLA